ncbi:MAG: S41 family peptidase [Fuerstiella sp.]|nr:S41 family peptidase [Fuerstiella sp.]
MHRSLLAGLSCLILVSSVVSIRADDADDDRREQYELMKLFVESFQQIESNYVTDVDRRELMEAAIQGMIQHLDQYSTYIPPANTDQFNRAIEQEIGGIGVHIEPGGHRIVVMSPLLGGPASRAGMRSGDIILEVDGTSLDGVTRREAIAKIRGPAGRPVRLSVLHVGEGEEPVEITIVREAIQIPTVYGFHLKEDKQWNFMYSDQDKVGFVHLTHFGRHTANEVHDVVSQLIDQGMKGLVLDLRSNPGGLLDVAIEICDMFLAGGRIVSVRGRNVADRSWDAKAANTFPDFPMAVLVNRYSASASEVVSAALQDNERAVIIGERTWGKGSVQNVIGLEDGNSQLKLTMASYHRPSGVNIHRMRDAKPEDDWGVKPNEGFEYKFDIAQFRDWSESLHRREFLRQDESTQDDNSDAFTDSQLNAAIDYLRENISAEQ